MANNQKNVPGANNETDLNVIDLSALSENNAAKTAGAQPSDPAEAPKKRGRKPKAQNEDAQAAKTDEQNEAPKASKTAAADNGTAAAKRGRKPKSQAENAPAVKTEKSTTAKKPASDSSAKTESATADAPKKRGRKPKSETETAKTEKAPAAAKTSGKSTSAKSSAAKSAGKTASSKTSKAAGAKSTGKSTAAKASADAPKKRGRKPKSEAAAAPAPTAAKRGGRKPKALTRDDVVAKAQKKAATADLSLFKYGVPVTFELTGACSGDFYINVIVEDSGKRIDVQPYRYDMHQVWIRADADTLAKVFDGKLDIYEALAGGDIHITGDPKQAILFINAVFAS